MKPAKSKSYMWTWKPDLTVRKAIKSGDRKCDPMREVKAQKKALKVSVA